MSCAAKPAEPIEVQFGMLSRVEYREHALHGNVHAPGEGKLLGVSGRLKSIEKHRI